MSDVVVREASPDEVPAIAEQLNAFARDLHGESEISEGEVARWFELPGIWIRVAQSDGRVAGYVDVADENQARRRFHVDLRTGDPGAAAALLHAAERYASEHALPDSIIRAYASEHDRTVRPTLERAGYRVVRHSFHMAIDDLSAVPEPALPEGIALRTYREVDEDAVWEAINDAFADHWDHQPPTPEGRSQWRADALENPRFDPTLWFLAEADGKLAGFSLCLWHWSGDPDHGWVQTLGVRRPWRRRGLGLALLHHSFREFARRGASRVSLGVDSENPTGAVRLYERAGMHVARRNDTWEKPLA